MVFGSVTINLVHKVFSGSQPFERKSSLRKDARKRVKPGPLTGSPLLWWIRRVPAEVRRYKMSIIRALSVSIDLV